jgi:hypothetical protein
MGAPLHLKEIRSLRLALPLTMLVLPRGAFPSVGDPPIAEFPSPRGAGRRVAASDEGVAGPKHWAIVRRVRGAGSVRSTRPQQEGYWKGGNGRRDRSTKAHQETRSNGSFIRLRNRG